MLLDSFETVESFTQHLNKLFIVIGKKLALVMKDETINESKDLGIYYLEY